MTSSTALVPATPRPTAPPPLPSLEALVRDSPWVAALPGLGLEAAGWQADAPRRRARITREASAAATPRIWTDTIGTLAATGWRIAATAAPDAPLALLQAASTAVGVPIGPASLTTSDATIARAQRLVRAGGPAYIKLGQFIASASGLLPRQWVEAFAWCRDEAPALRPGTAERIVDRELGRTGASGGLAWIDPEPLAAGSIGQVHRGRLTDGTDVVVKVRRPRLRRGLVHDIQALALAAAAAERLHPLARSAGVSAFVDLFARLTLEELDFRLEAVNLVELGVVFESIGSDHVRLPRPIPGMVTERLLVMEHVPGVSYARLAGTPATTGADGERLLHLGIKGVLETTLVHGLFHGDLHAGNVLVDGSGGFSLVDLGICGRLDAQQRAGLVAFLGAWATGDAHGQVEAMRSFGVLAPGADSAALVADLQVELDRIAARGDGAVTFERLGETLGRLLALLAAGGMRLPSELVLFFKNLLYLSGFAASVAPGTDVLAEVEVILAELFERYASELGG